MSGADTKAAVAKVAKSARGSKPGERRGGRVAGQPNKATRELKELAREYTEQALEALAGIMIESESDAARVSAANAILDRAYGKPSQTIDAGENMLGMVASLIAARREKVAALNG